MNKFLNLLQFLTRITVSKNLKYNEDMGSAMVYFPVVGIVIGLLLTIEYYFLELTIRGAEFNIFISLIIVITEAIMTGGLHIDGFGDTFDGLFSYRPKEKILEIMKDPTMGTNGILSIVFLIITKIICINIAINSKAIWIIFSMPVVGRLTPVVMSYKAVSARKNGMGELFIGRCSLSNLIGATMIASIVSMCSSYIWKKEIITAIVFLVPIAIIWCYAILFRNFVYKKIDGITGDILGCGTEMGEIIFLVSSIIIFQKIMQYSI